jgi:hypothetical protein
MIISNRHKFIFLKTNKTAGTSIEIALSKFCGPDDIITPISLEDEEIRSKMGYPGPQNYLSPISSYSVWNPRRWITRGAEKARFYNHISAKEVKARIEKDVWDSYYKFCFERNPWDRVISLYYWRNQSEPRPTISKFINSEALLLLKKKGHEIYTIDGKVVVDKVCKFENLAEELEVIRKHVGIPAQLELPVAKSQYRKDKRSYRDILGEEDNAKIMDLFHEEIDMFGYEW